MGLSSSVRQSPDKSGPDRSSNFRSPKKSGRYFDVKWLIISQNISKSSSGVFLKVFWLTLFPDRSPPRTSLDFPGLLLVFVEIMPDKVILDHKKSYLIIFGLFWKFSFLWFFTYEQFLLKIEKKWKSSKLTKHDQIWLFMV